MNKQLHVMLVLMILTCALISPSVNTMAAVEAPKANVRVGAIGASGEVIFYVGGRKRVYRNFSKKDYNGIYGPSHGGCVTATATVLSGLVNFYIGPDMVHQGTNRYSETYAIKKLGKNYTKRDTVTAAKRISNLNNSTPTNLMLNQIFKNAGLRTKYVKKVTTASYKEISQHLQKGYPVVFTTSKSKKYKGISLTNGSFSTVTMLGLNQAGKVLVMNSEVGRANYSHVQKKKFEFTTEEMVKHFIVSGKDKEKTDYYSGDRGGYILVYPQAGTTKVTAMRLSRRNLKMDKGEKFVLNAYINPGTTDQSVIWTSSNEEVLTVSEDGVVRAIAPGTATVKAISVQNPSFSDSCDITVFAGEVNSVTVTAPKRELAYGQKMKLKLKVDGGTKKDTIVWYSSNRSKATVTQNGVVTAKGNGFVDITAKVGAKSDHVTILTKRYSPMVLEGDIDVTIYDERGRGRTYRSYSQSAYNGRFGGERGCSITAAAIVMSGLINRDIDPETVHRGKSRYSETYAIKKLGNRYRKWDKMSGSDRIKRLDNSTATNLMVQEILGNAGLKTKYVRKITSGSATEVYRHLLRGDPVIFTTKKEKSYKGITLANTWHTLVMVGIDKDGYAIVINPAGGKVNYSHSKNKYFRFTPQEIIRHFETSSKHGTGFYDGGRFGYILVWK